ncbi:MAG TPA: hypothetical protein VKI00_31680 [Mycobacterium sp.]|uniref:hypothetical protein n=1 Tax=Mycobacterium sp. TaxID=1785 RepID=UPI002B909F06|nr:hypothetical protein [Mycobacterium sp.]HME80064.1 hypothetical protein [Mycobacterium sp.]
MTQVVPPFTSGEDLTAKARIRIAATDRVCGDAPDLEKYYELAEAMLGAVPQPHRPPADEAMGAIAVDLGVADTVRPVTVGVYFGEPGVEQADPYFGGDGPARSAALNAGCVCWAAATMPRTPCRKTISGSPSAWVFGSIPNARSYRLGRWGRRMVQTGMP